MATTTAPAMTWEAFEQLPDGDGFHRELLEGEIQILPPAKLGHGNISKRVFRILSALEQQGRGAAFHELGYKLTDDPPSWVQPDASFVLPGRMESISENDYVHGAPDLAVEVVSPSESASDVQRKTRLMLASGAKAVWVIYPKTQTVEVHTTQNAVTLTPADSLTAPFLLKDWSVPVAKLFED